MKRTVWSEAFAILRQRDRKPDPYAVEERAAILEFDAGLSREEAERQAKTEFQIDLPAGNDLDLQGISEALDMTPADAERWLAGIAESTQPRSGQAVKQPAGETMRQRHLRAKFR